LVDKDQKEGGAVEKNPLDTSVTTARWQDVCTSLCEESISTAGEEVTTSAL